MQKVIVDKVFLNLDSPVSAGLISGLKKLSRKGFSIEFDGNEPKEHGQLSRILKLEGITPDSKALENIEKTYVISASKKIVKTDYTLIRVQPESDTDTFEKAVNQIISGLRSSSQQRNTKETKITVNVSLDGKGISNIKTGVGFFDHMLEQIAKHANLNLDILVDGDLFVDEHHTVEDTGITLGVAIGEALGGKLGIKRYGFFLPMDESVAQCALDIGGRSCLVFKCKFKREKVGDFPTELTEEFFRGLAAGLKANIYLEAKGKNDHHKIEAVFKAFAKALNEACRMDERSENVLPSTKGVL
ncbi:MAG: imidazoleglycerol-phosphate dehydratase HisB [Ignavibacteria bacterium]